MISMKLRVFLALAATLMVTTGCTFPMKPLSLSETEIETHKLNDWFETQYKKGRFNGSVLVSSGGQVVYQRHFGVSHPESGALIDDNTLFNLASVSKQFTAFAILQLAYLGQLDLDAPVSLYLPEFHFSNTPTIRSLLNHRAGLTEYFKIAEVWPTVANPYTNEDVIKDLVAHHRLNSPAVNVKFRYSNSGYIVLAHIVERISHQSFEDYMAEKVFRPAGLTETRVFNLISPEEANSRAIGFKRGFGGRISMRDLNEWDGVAGDGAVYSNTADLLRWHQSLTQGELIPADYYAQAMLPYAGETKTNKPYGFGWFILGDKEVEHAGGWQGFSSYYYRNENTDSTIILLDNASHGLSMAPYGTRINSLSLNVKHWLLSLK